MESLIQGDLLDPFLAATNPSHVVKCQYWFLIILIRISELTFLDLILLIYYFFCEVSVHFGFAGGD